MSVPCTNTSGRAGCVAECPLSEWVQAGHDRGTTVRPLPSDEAVFAAARALLGMKIDDDDAAPLLPSRHEAAPPLLIELPDLDALTDAGEDFDGGGCAMRMT